jgi:N-acetylglutamate synthase-like GNAT family acetyltransferase
MLAPLAVADRRRVLEGMAAIAGGLGAPAAGRVRLRLLGAGGDLGWVVERHGAFYRNTYGWDERFEGLVAEVVAAFAAGHDAARERAWIAEVGGRRAGCVFLVKDGETIARLRVLYVEPWARGRGVGTRLLRTCLAFAEAAGYRRISLWTNDRLVEARRLYERAGFALLGEERQERFGADFTGQHWGRDL